MAVKFAMLISRKSSGEIQRVSNQVSQNIRKGLWDT
jgi:hypothetical protein